MSDITYDCPYCLEHYVLWDSSMPPISMAKHNDLSEAVRKQYNEVGTCKKCHRTDPNIPTTFEMDGLLTKEDILNRNKVYKYCSNGCKWQIVDYLDKKANCPLCGQNSLLNSSLISIRTFNPATAKSRLKSK